jgi:hypothetical protein
MREGEGVELVKKQQQTKSVKTVAEKVEMRLKCLSELFLY